MIIIRSETFERLADLLEFLAKDIVVNKNLESRLSAYSYCDLTPLLLRHYGGDWGEASLSQIDDNEYSLRNGGKLKSVFIFQNIKISIITDTITEVSYISTS